MSNHILCCKNYLSVPNWSEETTVCFLHGFGSNASIFRDLWARWGKGPRRWFLDGPEIDGFTSGRRWFPFTNCSNALARGIAKAADFVEKELMSRDLPSTFVLAGHSQGAMVCLELVRRRRLPISVAWCYSGFLPVRLRVPISGAAHTTVLHLLSSEGDRFIDPSQINSTAKFFQSQAGIQVHQHISATLHHEFSQEWLNPFNFRVRSKARKHDLPM